MPTRAWLLGVRLGRIMAVEGDRLVASWTGLGASGAGAPSRGVEQEAERTRFARLIHAARPRSWRTCGPRRLQWQAESGLIAAHGGDNPEQARLSRLSAGSGQEPRPAAAAHTGQRIGGGPAHIGPLARTGVTAVKSRDVV
jgi:hypothetical protein